MISIISPITAIFVIGIIAIVFKAFSPGKARTTQDYPYEKEHALFSPSERSFLGALEQAVDGRYRIMGKVRLADVIKVKGGLNNGAWQSAFNRIQSKHLDFVACDSTSLGVRFVVELDDKSHRQSKRQSRDGFVDKALQATGIPVFHFAARRSYSVDDLRTELRAVAFEDMK